MLIKEMAIDVAEECLRNTTRLRITIGITKSLKQVLLLKQKEDQEEKGEESDENEVGSVHRDNEEASK